MIPKGVHDLGLEEIGLLPLRPFNAMRFLAPFSSQIKKKKTLVLIIIADWLVMDRWLEVYSLLFCNLADTH